MCCRYHIAKMARPFWLKHLDLIYPFFILSCHMSPADMPVSSAAAPSNPLIGGGYLHG